MSLIPVIVKTAISADCSTLTVTDNTGNYNVSTNPGGYGSPNEARANLYIKLIVTIKKTVGDELITVPAYNENTVTSWSITLTEDGYYEVYSFLCKAWNALVTYAAGYIAYDVSTDTFYKSLQAANLNHAVGDNPWWTPCKTPAAEYKVAIALSQPDTYSDVDEFIELCNGVICRAKANVIAYDTDRTGSCGCGDKFREIDFLIKTARINAADSAYSKAQEVVENLQRTCNCIDKA